jgi:FkbM family methyltransferase
MDIPIIIICYNNYKYVKNTLLQIQKINKEYYKNIQILNNNSTCLDTIQFLKNVDVNVIDNSNNNGPWITDSINTHIYDSLPDKLILTDPDLKLNTNIPDNFIEILSELSDKYKTSKIGFALDISDYEKFYKDKKYFMGKSIYWAEYLNWQNKINDNNYELYEHLIDTTFSLMNKKYIHNQYYIRIAGNFTAKHLPWYKKNELYNVYENYITNIDASEISTTSKIIVSYIENKYLKIYKNKEFFLIKNSEYDENLSFWKDKYSKWENESFEIFDKYLSQDKIFIDIGGWIGATTMYGSRKSKHVYSIEADFEAFHDMEMNLKNNCSNNYTLLNKAIFNIDNYKVRFGKNIYMKNSKMNDSTSQIYNENIITSDSYLIETITLKNLIQNYQIPPFEISLIKVDIQGGEEYILNDLFDIHLNYGVPLYISFHYSWWKDKNIDRFHFLSSYIKKSITMDPFISILFYPL